MAIPVQILSKKLILSYTTFIKIEGFTHSRVSVWIRSDSQKKHRSMKEKLEKPYEDGTSHKLAYTVLQLLVMIKQNIGNDSIKYISFMLLFLFISSLISFLPLRHFCSFISSQFTHSSYFCSSYILPYICSSHFSSSCFSLGTNVRIFWKIHKYAFSIWKGTLCGHSHVSVGKDILFY
jgi:hypothetical protein